MATGFEVDVHALRSLASDLEQALHSMAAARAELGGATRGETGDASLDRACGEFQDKWGFGLQQLEKTTGAFVTGLEATVKAYAAVEDEIVKSMGGAAGAGAAVGGAMGQIGSGAAGGGGRIQLSGVPGTPGGPPRIVQPGVGGGDGHIQLSGVPSTPGTPRIEPGGGDGRITLSGVPGTPGTPRLDQPHNGNGGGAA